MTYLQITKTTREFDSIWAKELVRLMNEAEKEDAATFVPGCYS